MSDSSFSLTNLIFFLYHSWIDYQLEVKIRQLNTPPAYTQAVNELSYRRERTVYDVFNNDNDNGTYTVGNYRIPEWMNSRIGVWRWNHLGDRSWSAE